MRTELLLTSFATWRKHQRSNASDDILVGLQERGLPESIVLLRQLPVNLPVAREITVAKLQQLQPRILVLCGLAESRSRVSLEQQATVGGKTLQTSIDLNALAEGLLITEVSQNAGQFVCNSLYHSMLNYTLHDLQKSDLALACRCLFVHIPVVTAENRSCILADMRQILDRLLIWAGEGL